MSNSIAYDPNTKRQVFCEILDINSITILFVDP